MTMDLEIDRDDVHANGSVHSNGVQPETSAAALAIDRLRRRPRNIHLARGLGPLVVGVALFILMLWLAPSVAPEHIVERPVSATTTTVVVTTTTATTAPVETTTTVTP